MDHQVLAYLPWLTLQPLALYTARYGKYWIRGNKHFKISWACTVLAAAIAILSDIEYKLLIGIISVLQAGLCPLVLHLDQYTTKTNGERLLINTWQTSMLLSIISVNVRLGAILWKISSCIDKDDMEARVCKPFLWAAWAWTIVLLSWLGWASEKRLRAVNYQEE